MRIQRKSFGLLSDGQEVELFTIDNGSARISLMNLGATITSLLLPKGNSQFDDVVLGYSTLAQYLQPNPFFGCTVGRFANRISGGGFTIGNTRYSITTNEGLNTLHGGRRGFDRRVWEADIYKKSGLLGLRFSLHSPDGEEGFPGNLDCEALYTLDQQNRVSIEFSATTDAECPVNMTNHSYFNLRGEGNGNILEHQLKMRCSRYLVVRDDSIPTGEIRKLNGDAMDFTHGKPIGKDISMVGAGYDHCYCVDDHDGSLKLAAMVEDPYSKRSLEVFTTQPGVQLYTGNYLKDVKGKNCSIYQQHTGFCLETQGYPDAVNQKEFPNTLLKPGERYLERCVYAFKF